MVHTWRPYLNSIVAFSSRTSFLRCSCSSAHATASCTVSCSHCRKLVSSGAKPEGCDSFHSRSSSSVISPNAWYSPASDPDNRASINSNCSSPRTQNDTVMGVGLNSPASSSMYWFSSLRLSLLCCRSNGNLHAHAIEAMFYHCANT